MDILIAVNLLVNYFLLLATARVCRSLAKRWRLLVAAGFGAVYSLVIFADSLPLFLLTLSKFAVAVLMICMAFGYGGLRIYLGRVAAFFVLSSVFAGIMSFVQMNFSPVNMRYHNGVAYFNISILTLVFMTVLCYTVIRLVSHFLQSRPAEEYRLGVTIEVDGNQVFAEAMMDSGNNLTDLFLSVPVIVCEYKAVEPLLPADVRDVYANGAEGSSAERIAASSFSSRFRLIPVDTIGSSGLLPAFRPDNVVLEASGRRKNVRDVLIAVCNKRLPEGTYQALVGNNLAGTI